jgi:16S rRNA (uracil1498-N3)-methyltransferase
MQRFFVSPQAIRNGHVYFAEVQARQMRQVLRLRPGDEVIVLDNQGFCYRVRLRHIAKNQAFGQILAQTAATGDPQGELILNVALIRGERFEWLLQKGVELGVTHFAPMITQRTVRGVPGLQKWQRWQRIVQEAAEQCARATIPHLLSPRPFTAALQEAQGMALMPVVAAPQPVSAVLHNLSWPITLYVGPEGGFSAEEVVLAQESGVNLLSLGRRILRTETAGLTLLTLTLHALGEFDQPSLHSDSVCR